MRRARTAFADISCIAAARAFTIAAMRALPLLAACACNHLPAAPAPAPAAAAAPEVARIFAVADETMEFRASLRGMTVGIVQTAIGKPGWVDGRRAIIVRSRGKSDGLAALLGDVVWELETTIDLDAGVPIVDREDAWISVAGEHEHHGETRAWDDERHVHDVHSLIGLLRGWHSGPGEVRGAQVALGGDELRIRVWDAGRELTAAKPAIRYDGTVWGTLPFTLWISDDAAHVPLAFRSDTPLGAVAVELTDYQLAAIDP